jgi:peptidoglycan-associated lipoprotein
LDVAGQPPAGDERKKVMIKSLALGGVMLVVLLAGCAKQPVSSGGLTSAPAPGGARTDGAGTAGGFGAGGAGGSGVLSGAQRPAIKDFVAAPDLADIHFDFDRADIREPEAKVLDSHASWLKAHSDHFVLIEGHCDERGTNEYNTALGDRRAKATMNYLLSRGVAPARITLVSYGEERPVCAQHDDACWAKNRRAHFMMKAR